MKNRAQSHIGLVRLVLPIELRHQIVEPHLRLLGRGVEDVVGGLSSRSVSREFVTMAWSGFHDSLLLTGLVSKVPILGAAIPMPPKVEARHFVSLVSMQKITQRRGAEDAEQKSSRSRNTPISELCVFAVK
jgi:hypothetical protein